MAKKLGGLGKGLNAIFIENDSEKGDGAVTLKISEIEPNRSQPRQSFDDCCSRCLYVRFRSADMRSSRARDVTARAGWRD